MLKSATQQYEGSKFMDEVIRRPPPKMYRLAVEYMAEARGVPMSQIYQDALDALLADFDWSLIEDRLTPHE